MSRRLWVILSCAFLSCGPAEEPEGVTIASFRSGLSMSGAGGCSTGIAQGLTTQLIEELNCVTPNLMVNFTGSHTNLYSGVNPFLAPGASSAIRSATTAKSDFITISSAYRDIGAQYLLYRWWQQGRCGIQLAAKPGASNHQSGRAIDTPYYSYWKTALQNAGMTWLGSSDTVHFDHLASPNIASKSVLAFQRLWNKNHSTGRLAEDGQWGPATEAAVAATPVTGFPVHGCATTGKVSGTITDASGGAALSGVTVTAGGQTKTTSAAGTFEFTLGSGTFTVAASKSGYTSRSLSRAVILGGTVSASMTLTRVATEGTLSGTVVDSVDPSQKLSGASVTAGGQMKLTGADGAFTFTLPAGTATLAVSKQGYVAQQVQATLTAGATTTKTVALVLAATDGPPVLTVTTPSGSSDLAHLVLTGTASDDFSVLSGVQITQNGGAPVTAQLVGGEFSLPVQLAPGANALELSVTDDRGQRTAVTWTGAFRAGFDGQVHRFDDALAIVADAELTLFDPDTTTQVGTARTDLTGAFTLDASLTGILRLHVEKAGFTPRELLIDVSAEERTTLDIGLTPGDLAAIRIIEPEPNALLEGAELRVSGAVTGFEVASVTVNGEPATLLGSGFVLTLPLPEGRTTFEIVAESGEGATVRTEVSVRKPMAPVQGGCSSVPGASLLMLLVGLLVLRRRR